MGSKSVRYAKVTDHHGLCRECGSQLTQPETILTYWDYVSNNGMNGRRTVEKGISSIDVNAGICDNCQVKYIRNELEKEQNAAINKDAAKAPGSGIIALCWIGLFISFLALGLKATRLDEYGQSMPFITPSFFIWAGLGLICLIALPFMYVRRKRLCEEAITTINDIKTQDDATLLSKYRLKDNIPIMKWIWNRYVMQQFIQRKGGLVYTSELLQMGSP